MGRRNILGVSRCEEEEGLDDMDQLDFRGLEAAAGGVCGIELQKEGAMTSMRKHVSARMCFYRT